VGCGRGLPHPRSSIGTNARSSAPMKI
jgi:hypothetical protein